MALASEIAAKKFVHSYKNLEIQTVRFINVSVLSDTNNYIIVRSFRVY